MKRRAVVALILAQVAGAGEPAPWRLRVIHVNDLHSHLDPSAVTLDLEEPMPLRLGGAATLAAAFAALRREAPYNLTLHAGDQFSGTSWFSHYLGAADAAALGPMRLDAFVPGNHEFDKGPAVLARFLDSLRVPALAANLGSADEPVLAGKLRPALTLVRHGVRIGIVGVACPETPRISSPGRNLVFRSASVVRGTVDSLRRSGTGIVLLLSHAGFGTDTVLARIPGVSAVFGGHSHTRMLGSGSGSLLRSLPYPYVVRRGPGDSVPVAQAWEWGKEVGVLDLEIAGGHLAGWQGQAFLPLVDSVPERGSLPLSRREAADIPGWPRTQGWVRRVRPDSSVLELLGRLGRPLDSLRTTVVGVLPRPLTRRDGLVDACAQALREAARESGAQVGLVNAGGVREDLEAGPVTLDAVRRVQPFGNAVTVLTLTGRELVSVLRVLGAHRGHRVGLDGARLEPSDSGGVRLVLPGRGVLAPEDTVRVATNAYLGDGGDGCRMLRDAPGLRTTLPIDDAAALAGWISRHFPQQARPALHSAE